MAADPGPAAKNLRKGLNLGQLNRRTLQVANIQRFIGITGRFCPAFYPKSGSLGAKSCRWKKISAAFLAKVADIANFTT